MTPETNKHIIWKKQWFASLLGSEWSKSMGPEKPGTLKVLGNKRTD